jgi:MFS family permease
MLPQTAGFLIAGPLAGYLSDRFGARLFTMGGMILVTIGFALFIFLPVNFVYWQFALILVLMGLGNGLFGAPNNAAVMNSLPADCRGVGSGMRSAFWNSGQPLSNGVFFSLMTVGLSATLPAVMYSGLVQHSVPTAAASQIAHMPPMGYLFAALLGYNPMGTLLGPQVLNSLPAGAAQQLTSRSFFPQLIMAPFHHGLTLVLMFSLIICLIAAAVSWVRGKRYVYEQPAQGIVEENLSTSKKD